MESIYRIREVKTNDYNWFYPEKLVTKSKDKGAFWWKKTEVSQVWESMHNIKNINTYDIDPDNFESSFDVLVGNTIVAFKSKEQAEIFISNQKLDEIKVAEENRKKVELFIKYSLSKTPDNKSIIHEL